MSRRAFLPVFCVLSLARAFGAELGVGSSREDVIAQLGPPKSTTAAGTREILGYAGGRITLEDRHVARIDWKGAMPGATPPPAPAPAAPTPKPAAAPATASDAWTTDFAAAQKEATSSHRRLLVLFTGSDWCPACQHFEGHVAHTPDFLTATQSGFVLVKLDFPRHTPQPPEIHARNEELLKRYSIEAFPTLVVMNPDGTKSVQVDTSHARPARDVVDFFVQAVNEAAKEKTAFWSR